MRRFGHICIAACAARRGGPFGSFVLTDFPSQGLPRPRLGFLWRCRPAGRPYPSTMLIGGGRPSWAPPFTGWSFACDEGHSLGSILVLLPGTRSWGKEFQVMHNTKAALDAPDYGSP